MRSTGVIILLMHILSLASTITKFPPSQNHDPVQQINNVVGDKIQNLVLQSFADPYAKGEVWLIEPVVLKVRKNPIGGYIVIEDILRNKAYHKTLKILSNTNSRSGQSTKEKLAKKDESRNCDLTESNNEGVLRSCKGTMKIKRQTVQSTSTNETPVYSFNDDQVNDEFNTSSNQCSNAGTRNTMDHHDVPIIVIAKDRDTLIMVEKELSKRINETRRYIEKNYLLRNKRAKKGNKNNGDEQDHLLYENSSKTENVGNSVNREFPIQPQKYYIFPPFINPKGFTLEEARASLVYNPWSGYIVQKVSNKRLPHRFFHELKRNIMNDKRRSKRNKLLEYIFRAVRPSTTLSEIVNKRTDQRSIESYKQYIALFPPHIEPKTLNCSKSSGPNLVRKMRECQRHNRSKHFRLLKFLKRNKSSRPNETGGECKCTGGLGLCSTNKISKHGYKERIIVTYPTKADKIRNFDEFVNIEKLKQKEKRTEHRGTTLSIRSESTSKHLNETRKITSFDEAVTEYIKNLFYMNNMRRMLSKQKKMKSQYNLFSDSNTATDFKNNFGNQPKALINQDITSPFAEDMSYMETSVCKQKIMNAEKSEHRCGSSEANNGKEQGIQRPFVSSFFRNNNLTKKVINVNKFPLSGNIFHTVTQKILKVLKENRNKFSEVQTNSLKKSKFSFFNISKHKPDISTKNVKNNEFWTVHMSTLPPKPKTFRTTSVKKSKTKFVDVFKKKTNTRKGTEKGSNKFTTVKLPKEPIQSLVCNGTRLNITPQHVFFKRIKDLNSELSEEISKNKSFTKTKPLNRKILNKGKTQVSDNTRNPNYSRNLGRVFSWYFKHKNSKTTTSYINYVITPYSTTTKKITENSKVFNLFWNMNMSENRIGDKKLKNEHNHNLTKLTCGSNKNSIANGKRSIESIFKKVCAENDNRSYNTNVNRKRYNFLKNPVKVTTIASKRYETTIPSWNIFGLHSRKIVKDCHPPSNMLRRVSFDFPPERKKSSRNWFSIFKKTTESSRRGNSVISKLIDSNSDLFFLPRTLNNESLWPGCLGPGFFNNENTATRKHAVRCKHRKTSKVYKPYDEERDEGNEQGLFMFYKNNGNRTVPGKIEMTNSNLHYCKGFEPIKNKTINVKDPICPLMSENNRKRSIASFFKINSGNQSTTHRSFHNCPWVTVGQIQNKKNGHKHWLSVFPRNKNKNIDNIDNKGINKQSMVDPCLYFLPRNMSNGSVFSLLPPEFFNRGNCRKKVNKKIKSKYCSLIAEEPSNDKQEDFLFFSEIGNNNDHNEEKMDPFVKKIFNRTSGNLINDSANKRSIRSFFGRGLRRYNVTKYSFHIAKQPSDVRNNEIAKSSARPAKQKSSNRTFFQLSFFSKKYKSTTSRHPNPWETMTPHNNRKSGFFLFRRRNQQDRENLNKKPIYKQEEVHPGMYFPPREIPNGSIFSILPQDFFRQKNKKKYENKRIKNKNLKSRYCSIIRKPPQEEKQGNFLFYSKTENGNVSEEHKIDPLIKSLFSNAFKKENNIEYLPDNIVLDQTENRTIKLDKRKTINEVLLKNLKTEELTSVDRKTKRNKEILEIAPSGSKWLISFLGRGFRVKNTTQQPHMQDTEETFNISLSASRGNEEGIKANPTIMIDEEIVQKLSKERTQKASKETKENGKFSKKDVFYLDRIDLTPGSMDNIEKTVNRLTGKKEMDLEEKGLIAKTRIDVVVVDGQNPGKLDSSNKVIVDNQDRITESTVKFMRFKNTVPTTEANIIIVDGQNPGKLDSNNKINVDNQDRITESTVKFMRFKNTRPTTEANIVIIDPEHPKNLDGKNKIYIETLEVTTEDTGRHRWRLEDNEEQQEDTTGSTVKHKWHFKDKNNKIEVFFIDTENTKIFNKTYQILGTTEDFRTETNKKIRKPHQQKDQSPELKTNLEVILTDIEDCGNLANNNETIIEILNPTTLGKDKSPSGKHTKDKTLKNTEDVIVIDSERVTYSYESTHSNTKKQKRTTVKKRFDDRNVIYLESLELNSRTIRNTGTGIPPWYNKNHDGYNKNSKSRVDVVIVDSENPEKSTEQTHYNCGNYTFCIDENGNIMEPSTTEVDFIIIDSRNGSSKSFDSIVNSFGNERDKNTKMSTAEDEEIVIVNTGVRNRMKNFISAQQAIHNGEKINPSPINSNSYLPSRSKNDNERDCPVKYGEK